ncbi:hypothetical protein QEN19_001636 [Hanseniaspora menglaensis]
MHTGAVLQRLESFLFVGIPIGWPPVGGFIERLKETQMTKTRTDTDCHKVHFKVLVDLLLAFACNELQELRCWLYDFMTGCVCNQCMLYHAALPNFTITKVLHLAAPHYLALCSINNIPQRLAFACNELQELRCWLYDFMTGCVCNQCMLYHAALPNFTITKVLHLAAPHYLALCSINNIPQRLAFACNELQELRCWLYDFMTGCVVGRYLFALDFECSVLWNLLWKIKKKKKSMRISDDNLCLFAETRNCNYGTEGNG